MLIIIINFVFRTKIIPRVTHRIKCYFFKTKWKIFSALEVIKLNWYWAINFCAMAEELYGKSSAENYFGCFLIVIKSNFTKKWRLLRCVNQKLNQICFDWRKCLEISNLFWCCKNPWFIRDFARKLNVSSSVKLLFDLCL